MSIDERVTAYAARLKVVTTERQIRAFLTNIILDVARDQRQADTSAIDEVRGGYHANSSDYEEGVEAAYQAVLKAEIK